MTEEKKIETHVEEAKPTRAEVKIDNDGRIYQLIVPADATLGECYDAAFRLLQKVLDIAKENAEKARPKKVEDTEEKEVS